MHEHIDSAGKSFLFSEFHGESAGRGISGCDDFGEFTGVLGDEGRMIPRLRMEASVLIVELLRISRQGIGHIDGSSIQVCVGYTGGRTLGGVGEG